MQKQSQPNDSYMKYNQENMEIHTHDSQLNSLLALQNSNICVLNMNFLNSSNNFQSFSLKSIILHQKNNDKSSLSIYCDMNSKVQNQQDPLFKVLSLNRGKSQKYSQSQDCNQITDFAYEQPTYIPSTVSFISSHEDIHHNILLQADSVIIQSSSPQQFSHGVNYQNLEQNFKNQSKNSHSIKQSTKNVTKNMGKLLFKFIWKNKDNLRQKLQIKKQKWLQFICEVKRMKKTNNITRQFLKKIWHQSSQYDKIFRIISNHFFRSRFHQAIYQSKIQHKQMYLQRRHRFQKGIQFEDALNNLN